LAIGFAMIGMNPIFSEYVAALVRTATWPSAFLSATLFHWPLLAIALWWLIGSTTGLVRIAVASLLGYLIVYATLFGLWHVYYGAYWECGDAHALLWTSDKAIPGLLLGAIAGWMLNKRAARTTAADPVMTWFGLWFLVFVSIMISAFLGGRLLLFCPGRLIVFVGLPMAVLAAHGADLLARRHPRLASLWTCLIVMAGVCSITVGSLFFQGPLGYKPGQKAFAYVHHEVMSEQDAACLAHVGDGVFIAPQVFPSFEDFRAVRGNSVLFGYGAMNLSDTPLTMAGEHDRFFTPGASTDERRKFVDKWCVDWVYCPDSPPVDDRLLDEFRQIPWLHEVASEGNAVLFKVEH